MEGVTTSERVNLLAQRANATAHHAGAKPSVANDRVDTAIHALFVLVPTKVATEGARGACHAPIQSRDEYKKD